MDSEKIGDITEPKPEDANIGVIAAKAIDIGFKKQFAQDNKPYDPTRPHEIHGPAGTIGVVRGHMNSQRLAGKAVAVALQGLNVDQRTYEMTYMSIMLQFVTQSPGYLPAYANGNIDTFLENIFEFEDLLHYYQEWENWRNSFRVSKPAN